MHFESKHEISLNMLTQASSVLDLSENTLKFHRFFSKGKTETKNARDLCLTVLPWLKAYKGREAKIYLQDFGLPLLQYHVALTSEERNHKTSASTTLFVISNTIASLPTTHTEFPGLKKKINGVRGGAEKLNLK